VTTSICKKHNNKKHNNKKIFNKQICIRLNTQMSHIHLKEREREREKGDIYTYARACILCVDNKNYISSYLLLNLLPNKYFFPLTITAFGNNHFTC